MLVKRVLVTAVLLPIGLVLIYLGGWFYAGFVTLMLSLAAFEYVNLFRAAGLQPAGILVVGGTILLVAGRQFSGFQSAPWMISLLVMASMAYHLIRYEQGRDRAATDFNITLGGALYLGWIGGYLISLRSLPDGLWWVLLVLPAVWLADSGAYFIGSKFGRHKMTSRLSPKKSWEGYLGGIAVSTIGTPLLAALWSNTVNLNAAFNPLNGAILGLAISTLTIFGDLGASMIKRQVGWKDSGTLLPGHGGVFDRIDSWLWAGVIGFYVIEWIFL